MKYTEHDMINILSSKNLTYVKYEEQYVYYICNIHKEYGEFRVRYDHLETMKGCPKCANKYKTTDEAKNNPNINKDIEIVGEYNGWNIKTECVCKICNNHFYMDWNHLYRGQKCPKCSKDIGNAKRTKSHDKFVMEMNNKHPNIEVIGKYVNSHKPIRCKCKTCGTVWDGIAFNILKGLCGCPLCNSSVGERMIAEYLNSKQIKYYRQYVFDDCKLKQKLRFDFYIPENNICIEFQGEQHYYPVNFSGHSDLEKQFAYTTERDEIKRKYCQENNIKLIEVPYTYRDENKIKQFLTTYDL